MPGYTTAQAKVGRFGEGMTQGRPVASCHIPRRQPCTGSTSSAAPYPSRSLARRINSPSVSPWRIGIGRCPTKERCAGSTIGPSISSPPIGLGRSSSSTGVPVRPQTSSVSATVAA